MKMITSSDGRVVKAIDSKSIGLCPRRFESCSLRKIFCLNYLNFCAFHSRNLIPEIFLRSQICLKRKKCFCVCTSTGKTILLLPMIPFKYFRNLCSIDVKIEFCIQNGLVCLLECFGVVCLKLLNDDQRELTRRAIWFWVILRDLSVYEIIVTSIM